MFPLRLELAGLALILILALSGCGGGGGGASQVASKADEVARSLDEAINATPAPSQADELQVESAAKLTICDALDAYSTGAEITVIALQERAEQQRIAAANLTLQGVDPEAASRLASAAAAIQDSQEAADVAEKLGCSF